ncbi:hypothetical protein GCM10009806_04670 [Microbacterium flavum]
MAGGASLALYNGGGRTRAPEPGARQEIADPINYSTPPTNAEFHTWR